MRRISATFYPSKETDQMIRLLAGIRGQSYNAVVLKAIEEFLSRSVDGGEFDEVSDLVAAFEAKKEVA